MMVRSAVATTAWLFCLTLSPVQLRAQDAPPPPPDEIELKSGARILGTVTSCEDGTLSVSTDELGDVTVDLANVVNLVTHHTVVLRSTTGERREGRITGIADGKLQLATPEAGTSDFAIADLDQINPPEGAVWSGDFNIGLTESNGNTDRRAVAASAEVTRRTERNRLFFRGAWNYADENTTGTRVLTERRLYGEAKDDQFISEKSFLYVKGDALGDTLAAIALRWTATAGYGYQFADREDLAFRAEVGAGYVSQAYTTPGVPNEEYFSGRLAYSLNWEIVTDLRFMQDVEYLPSLESASAYLVTADSRLRLFLTTSLFAQAEHVMRYNSKPSPGLKTTDNLFLLTAGWTF